VKDDAINLGPLTPDDPPAMLDYFGQVLKRGDEHRSLPAPLLERDARQGKCGRRGSERTRLSVARGKK
jgi:hypothetical protein